MTSCYLPSKSANNHTPNHHITRSTQYQVPMEHTQRDESCKPEQTEQSVEGENEPFAEEAAVGFDAATGEDGVKDQVGEGEEGDGCDGDEVGG